MDNNIFWLEISAVKKIPFGELPPKGTEWHFTQNYNYLENICVNIDVKAKQKQ